MIIRLAKNSTSTGPSANRLYSYSAQAIRIAGSTPATMRMIDMPISAATSSQGRSGLTKTWPRLRDHSSSRKLMATPICDRSATSHSSTPPSSVAPASAAPLPMRAIRKRAVNPQMHICSTGQ